DVELKGKGGENEGFVGLKAQRNLYEDDRTSLSGTVKGQSQWKDPYPAQHAGMARLDGTRTLIENDRTKVTGSGFAQREVATGMRPHDSFGVGVEATHNIYKGKNGEVDVFGGVQRQWNTPDRHQARGGIRWRF
uniref:Hemiptericin n=2 Tax=Pyrrhocoris apterus TaxID=37000 RepID=HEMI_PYRAP|nr:RecName: Full=Hemiptericin [Pyrrhocoris apterus]